MCTIFLFIFIPVEYIVSQLSLRNAYKCTLICFCCYSSSGLVQCHPWKTSLSNQRWSSSKIYDAVDPTWDGCRQAPATRIHMFWSCPSLYTYWLQVFNSISVCIMTPFEATALTALFGVLPPTLSLPIYKADFVAFVTLLARRQIFPRWKSPTSPSHSS